MPISPNDLAQYLTLLGGVVTGVMGYGKLQAKVEIHDEEIDKRVTKDSMEPFKDEVIRRLERIEHKQDKANGNS